MGISMSAFAQSSVTIFGIVDETVSYYQAGSNHSAALVSNGMVPSRWGFTGREDLGGGYAAGFWLENGFSPNNGTFKTANTIFDRRSTVSLFSPFGELRLGRDMTPTYLADWTFDPFWDTGLGGFAASNPTPVQAGNQAPTTSARTSNGISYLLPDNRFGINAHLTMSTSNGDQTNRYVGGSIGYTGGPLAVLASWSQTYTEPSPFKYMTIGGSYAIGALTVMVRGNEKELGSAKFINYGIGGTYKIGAGSIRTEVTFNRGRGSESGHQANMYALGYSYSLSKATTLYGQVAYLDNMGLQASALYGGPSVGPGMSTSGIQVGIQHRF
jgi:predicted porin